MQMKQMNKMNPGCARIGHSKWKSALGHTLLIIGMVLGLGGVNAWGQDEIPDALKLDKYFVPDDETGHSGKLWLETYTTGSVEHITTSQPTDIVLVLDASNSMKEDDDDDLMMYYTPSGSTSGFYVKRITALQMAVRNFIDIIYQDAVDNNFGENAELGQDANYDHRIAVVTFNSSAYLQTASSANATLINTNYIDALVPVRQYYSSRLSAATLTGTGQANLSSNNITAMDNGRIYNAISNGTVMANGLNAAAGVLNARSTTGGGGETFTVPGTTTELPRNMVVVFFTDGYPCQGRFTDPNYWPTNQYSLVTNANNAVAAASTIKQITALNPSGGAAVNPTVYSIAVNAGADPAAAYTIQYGNTSGNPSSTTTNYYVTGTRCFNALLHFISNDYGSEINTWATPAQNTDYGGQKPDGTGEGTGRNPGFYFAAENVDDLTEIFGNISSASGGTTVDMGANTVVQDVISASFKLPDDADVNSIKVYAPMLKRGGTDGKGLRRRNDDSPWEYYFYDTISGNTGTIEDQSDYLGRLTLNLTTGRVTDSTYENRVNSSDVISISEHEKTISFTHFDFSHYYCGPELDEHGDTTGYVGRKLVMVIPIEIEEGVWGDGIETNGELSFVTPDGEVHYQFPKPAANVLADVWTEVVQYQPATFDVANDPIEIGTPEDLAWFISYVNGRAGYENNDQISSHPSANAILTADIDMSAHNWVPIGAGNVNANGVMSETKLAYTGTFDGNGHVITGLKNNASKYFKKVDEETGKPTVVVFPGMFSNVGNGGVVKNVFVLDADFRGKRHDNGFVHHGIIADTLSAGGQIFNCEAVGSITCNNDKPADDMKLVYGGLVGLNHGTIHSSMAMATLTGYSMGGAVGENRGTLANSFTNGVYNYLGTSDGVVWNPEEEDPGGLFRYVGGLVGRNHGGDFVNGSFVETCGTINNCYVRFQRDNSYGDPLSSNAIQFGQLVGSNCVTNSTTKGTITNCYWPYNLSMRVRVADDTETDYGNLNYYTDPTAPSLMRYQRSNDNMVGGTPAQKTYTINGVPTTVTVWQNGTTLVDVLNGNIPEANSTWSHWKRTTAGNYVSSQNGGNINGDYPVLKIDGFTCLASTDGIALDYATSLDEMLDRHNTGVMNEGTALPGAVGEGEYNGVEDHDYSVSQAPTLYGATINLYDNDGPIVNSTQSGEEVARTVVYIDEDVSLLQDASSTIDAYTGQTLINFNGSNNIQAGNRWHNVSSSLQESRFGWGYHITGEVPHAWGDDWAGYKAEWDAANPEDLLTPENPCKIWLAQADEDHEIFPSDMASPNPMDFYCFYEPKYHWINFKRNSNSHWHMDSYTTKIEYTNEEAFVPGKGYLLAIHAQYFDDMYFWTESEHAKKDRQFLQNRGTLNNGTITIPVTNTPGNDYNGYNTGRTGYNLLGNPYQSYLDFDAFVNKNSGLMGGSDFANTYAVYDPESGNWLQYAASASKEATAADRYINMHQGFFIQVNTSDDITFTNDMRTNTAGNGFRAAENHYPLINFTLTDSEGGKDIAVLEVGRPENDGAKKIFVSSSTGRLYLRHDSEDFAILFRDMTKGSQPLYFDAKENGTFTLSWNTANANFQSLTLVDNIAGVKYDMLTHDSYTFEGNTDNYKSRFKVVIGEFAGIDEEDGPSTGSGTFAFFDGSEWVVNGQGQLDVVDMLGRTMLSERLTSDQSRVSLEGIAQGVYLMRVTNGNEVKVQKIVVR